MWLACLIIYYLCSSAVVGEMDEDIDSQLNLANIRAEPLSTIAHWERMFVETFGSYWVHVRSIILKAAEWSQSAHGHIWTKSSVLQWQWGIIAFWKVILNVMSGPMSEYQIKQSKLLNVLLLKLNGNISFVRRKESCSKNRMCKNYKALNEICNVCSSKKLAWKNKHYCF